MGHSGAITALAFSPDGARLITAGADRLVKIWDPISGQEILSFKGHRHPVSGLAFSPDGRRLLSSDIGGMLLRWETGKD
jgi:WD40 repeat protein